jgi:hypothetical protein
MSFGTTNVGRDVSDTNFDYFFTEYASLLRCYVIASNFLVYEKSIDMRAIIDYSNMVQDFSLVHLMDTISMFYHLPYK